jgi:hypothetical protein
MTAIMRPERDDDSFEVLGIVLNKIPVFCLYEKGTIRHLYKCTVTARIGNKIRSLGCIYRRRHGDAKDARKALVPYLKGALKANKDLK